MSDKAKSPNPENESSAENQWNDELKHTSETFSKRLLETLYSRFREWHQKSDCYMDFQGCFERFLEYAREEGSLKGIVYELEKILGVDKLTYKDFKNLKVGTSYTALDEMQNIFKDINSQKIRQDLFWATVNSFEEKLKEWCQNLWEDLLWSVQKQILCKHIDISFKFIEAFKHKPFQDALIEDFFNILADIKGWFETPTSANLNNELKGVLNSIPDSKKRQILSQLFGNAPTIDDIFKKGNISSKYLKAPFRDLLGLESKSLEKQLAQFVVRMSIVSASDEIGQIFEKSEGLLVNIQQSVELPYISKKLWSIAELLQKRYGKDVLIPYSPNWRYYFEGTPLVEEIQKYVVDPCTTNNLVCIHKKYFEWQLKLIHSVDAGFAEFIGKYFDHTFLDDELLWRLWLEKEIDRKFNDILFEKRIKELFEVDDTQYQEIHKFFKEIYDPNQKDVKLPNSGPTIKFSRKKLITTQISKPEFREKWVWALKDAKIGVEMDLEVAGIEDMLEMLYPSKVSTLPDTPYLKSTKIWEGASVKIDGEDYKLKGILKIPQDGGSDKFVLIVVDSWGKEKEIQWEEIKDFAITKNTLALNGFSWLYGDDLDLLIMSGFLSFKPEYGDLDRLWEALLLVRGKDLVEEFIVDFEEQLLDEKEGETRSDVSREEGSISDDSQGQIPGEEHTNQEEPSESTIENLTPEGYIEKAEEILKEFSGENHASIKNLEDGQGIVLFHYAGRPKGAGSSLFEQSGMFDWIKINIIRINQNSYRIVFEPLTEFGKANKEIVVDAKWLFKGMTNIKDSMSSSIFKTKKVIDFIDAGRYLSEWEVSNDYKKIGDNISNRWKKKTKWWRNEVLIKEWEFAGEKIAYVGRPTKKWGKDVYQLFKVSFENNVVEIRAAGVEKGKPFRMSYDAFLIWVGSNWFEGYTQTQYEQFEMFQKVETPKGIHKPGGFVMWFSLGAIAGGFKSIWDAWMAQIKERQEFDATKFHYLALENAFSKFMGKAFGSAFQDVLADAFTEYDSKIWWVINKYKDLLSRDGWVDSWEALKKVERDLFLKYPKGNIKGLREKLKAAGYLMFVAESGWATNLYPKALAKYASDSVWVRLILWEEHRKAFRAKYSSQLAQLANNPDNRKLVEDLWDLEAVYIFENLKKDKKAKNVFGSKFPKAFIKTFGSSRSSASVDEYSKGISSVSFSGIFEDVRGNIWDLKVAEALWGLKALMSKATIWEEGRIALGAYLAPLVAGLPVSGHFSRDILDDYVKLGRTFGIPAHGFIIDYDGSVKFVRLLDAISKSIGIKPFSSFAKEWSPENIRPQNFSKHFDKILNKYWEWRFAYGDQLERVLLLANLDEENSLLKIKHRYQEKKKQQWLTPIEEEELKAIEAYLSRANQAEIGKSIFEWLMDPESPFLENVWAHGPYVMVNRWLAINPHTGAFTANKERQAHYIWNSIKKWFEGADDVATEEKETMGFILQKYALWFKDRVYTSDWLEDFWAVIYYCLEKGDLRWDECDDLLDKITLGAFFKRYHKLPGEVQDALKAFKKLLKNRLNKEKLWDVAKFLSDSLGISISNDDNWITSKIQNLKYSQKGRARLQPSMEGENMSLDT